jgi:hypothetical protein
MNQRHKRSQTADDFDLSEGGRGAKESVTMGQARNERRLKAKKSRPTSSRT